MHLSHSSFETEKASRYLQQLCKHFAHKVTVEFEADHGHVVFPAGQAELTADPTTLTFSVRAETQHGLERCKMILEDHIVRFAFREKLTALDWEDQHHRTVQDT